MSEKDEQENDNDAAEGAATSGNGEDEASSAPPASPIKTGLRIVAALVILFLAFKFGVGPLISAGRGLKTVVIVKNSSETTYKLRLGWRMISNSVIGNSQTQFELDVGMPETQGLLIVSEDGKVSKKIRVPVRPGGVTLVNLDQEAKFYVFEPDKIEASSIAGSADLAKELISREPPRSAVKVVNSIRELGKTAFKEDRNDLFFDLTKYKPQGGIGYYTSNKANPVTSPVLTLEPFQLEMKTENGSVKFNPDVPKIVEGSIYLESETKVQLSPEYAVTIPKTAQLRVTFSDKERLDLRFGVGNQKIKHAGKDYNGNWNYAGFYDPAAKAWHWSWTYDGYTTNSQPQDRFRLNITFSDAGDKPATVTPPQKR